MELITNMRARLISMLPYLGCLPHLYEGCIY